MEIFKISEVPASVPLPAALPLFATGFGVMGLFGWQKAEARGCLRLVDLSLWFGETATNGGLSFLCCLRRQVVA